jgi:hypothetical protein
MSRHLPRDPRHVIRRLRATLDDRAADYEVTPAFAERVRRLRDRRRRVRRSAMAATLTAAVVVLALVAGNVLWPRERIGLVSRPTASPSPTTTTGSASPSAAPAEAASPSDRPSMEPSEPRSEAPSPSESATPSEPTTGGTAETLTRDTPLDLYGIGPIEAGMTLGEAEQAAGVGLTAHNFEDFGGVCYYATADGMEEDFVLMVVSPDGEPLDDPRDGIVVTASVHSLMKSPAQTLSGVAIGDTEQEVYDTYPGQIVGSEPHFYVEGGHYLYFAPRDPADRDYNVKFSTDGEVVQDIHAGDADYTRAVEGCA